MNRLFILYLIFIVLYSLMKGKKKQREEAEKPIEDGLSPPPTMERGEEEKDELDIFSFPLEEDEEKVVPDAPSLDIPPPFIPPKSKRVSISKQREEVPVTLPLKRKRVDLGVLNLRRGIVLSEILGPPRSRRPYAPTYKRR